MHHVLLTICLIANLLACPLRCARCNAPAGGEQGLQKPRTCQCCAKNPACASEGTSRSSQQQGEQPKDDCSCPNCICEGATLAKAAESSIHTLGAFVNHCDSEDSSSRLDSMAFGVSGACFQCLPHADTPTALALRQSWRI